MVVQVVGWVAVVWLIAVHLLIQQGRMHRGGTVPRLAGVLAALVIAVAGLLAEIWPVFVLGLLWLRSELWHRHSPDDSWFPPPEEHPHLDLPDAEVTHESHRASDPRPVRADPAAPASRSGGSTATKPRAVPAPRTRPAPGRSGRPSGAPSASSRPEHQEDHTRRPVVSRRMVDVLFRIEITLLILVTVAAFAFWGFQNRPGFAHKANTNLCRLLGGC